MTDEMKIKLARKKDEMERLQLKLEDTKKQAELDNQKVSELKKQVKVISQQKINSSCSIQEKKFGLKNFDEQRNNTKKQMQLNIKRCLLVSLKTDFFSQKHKPLYKQRVFQ